ncbi:FtsK/SpoIIIE family DNA translocase [Thomasclavelia saccharogumia]|uniref:FtsK/SpoIIIE family DNA translocase n=1 Tax=Thomasclavelia saccharogumia TaxID=341225 RepID=UPI00047ECB72|nr:DNA translocase FtsK [Thomasclavelia saccharogumia]
MAKTSRSKKSKQEQLSEDLKVRIIAAVGLFLTIVATLKLGLIGVQLNFLCTYILGNFVGIGYVALILVSIYVIYHAKLPRFNGPNAIGFYLLSGAVLTFMSSLSDNNMTGMKVIDQYIQQAPCNRGGFIGALLYGLLSALFDKTGAIIASGFVLVISLALLGSKFYLEQRKKKQTTSKKKKNKEKTQSKFIDFFTKKRDIAFFPDDIFEIDDKKPEKKTSARIHTAHLEEDDSIPSAMEFDEKSMTLEIKEKEPKIHDNDSLKTKQKINKNYRLPALSLLKNPTSKKSSDNKDNALKKAEALTNVLHEFGVNASISDIFIGPSVTKYELKLETGIRVNKIIQLQDDIKLALAAKDIRIEAPIPGKPAVGVEIPNSIATTVTFKEVIKDIPKELQANKLLVPLGKDVSGKTIYAQLNKMPHLLIAGATGSGKSVCINTIICSILMRARPDEVKFILVDPKKVELANYNGIPHLLAPVVTDPKKAAAVLQEVVVEMERRYDLFAEANVRNIESYNSYIHKKNETLALDEQLEFLPFHVIILDEVADLMMVASKQVEDCIMRIAQMARAAGIHLIVATQRPSTDIITGVIKANIPSRIAFAVSSGIDSRTILDTSGAEKLLGKGDMLFSPMGSSSPVRVQGAFVSDEEVNAITHHTASQQGANYDEKYINVKLNTTSMSAASKEEEEDEEYEMCRSFVISVQKASTSLLQRQFRIGYNKAARIIDQLEADGVIGPQIGSKPREVYIRGYQEEDV